MHAIYDVAMEDGEVMDVKLAVEHAKSQITALFGGEGIKNVGLEEVMFDEKQAVWHVTIGFSRPWDEPKNALAALAGQNSFWRRAYKVVTMDDVTGNVISVKSVDVPE